jgi:hypothetical protein
MIDPRALIRCSKCGQHISGMALQVVTGYADRDLMKRCPEGGAHFFPGLTPTEQDPLTTGNEED